jgi:hypothetical protein
MFINTPEGFPDREVPYEHIAVVEGGYFDGAQPPQVAVGDMVVTRFGDIAVEVFDIDDEGGVLAGYDRDDERVRFRVLPNDLIDMTRYHTAVLEVMDRPDKAIAVSDDGRHISMFDQGTMN